MKPFHYMWLLLLIVLVAWRTLEDSQFHNMEPDVCEVVKLSSLWASKEKIKVMENKIFWVPFEMDLHTIINQRSRLSLALFQQYSDIVDFKEGFQSVSIHTKKYLEKV